MKLRSIAVMAAVVLAAFPAECRQPTNPKKPSLPTAAPAASQLGEGAALPTAEEMAPMRPDYLAELAKVQEPPEMTGKPMQVRKAISPDVVKLGKILAAIGSPEKATHQVRAGAIRDLLEIARTGQLDKTGRVTIYSAVPALACIDGANPQTVIGYANNATGDGGTLALRAKMYLRAGDRKRSLEDLEKLLADGDGHALSGGGIDPRKASDGDVH